MTMVIDGGAAVTQLANRIPRTAQRLDISERHTWRLIARGELRAFRLGSRVLVAEDDLREFLERQRSG